MKISHPSPKFLIIFCITIPLFFSTTLAAQTSNQKISECFLKSDFKQLSSYFDENINLEIQKDEGTFSKKEAEKKLIQFFSKNPIQDFKMVHEGGSNKKLKYLIGNVSSSSKKYRTYILYRENGGKIIISEVRIDAEM